MTSFGRSAAELVREVATAEAGTLPPHNDEKVRAVQDEANEHYRAIMATVGAIEEAGESLDQAPPKAAASIFVHHEALLRNKRLLMAYEMERLKRLKAMRWELGKKTVPEHVRANMSHAEEDFMSKYDANLRAYFKDVGMDLSLDQRPPKACKVEVRVLRSLGRVATEDGEVDMREGTCHLMWREEAQPLVADGAVEVLHGDTL